MSSWNPLSSRRRTSGGGRAPLKLPSFDGDEAELNSYINKLVNLEDCVKKLSKDAKKFSDLTLSVNRCEKKMTADLSNSSLCQQDEELRKLVEEWHSFNCGADEASQELVMLVHKTVVEPVKRFSGVFSEVRVATRKRDQTLRICMKNKEKVQSLQEKEFKTAQYVVKLEHSKIDLENMFLDYKRQVASLKEEIPQVYDGRIDFFQPCLEALIKSEISFWGDETRLFNSLMDTCKQQRERKLNSEEQQQKRFASLQALSIVGTE
ncbi:bridging integrator 3-like [Limulus polyphemus]|uniref:Bridging integrator 3-like n=1 Tax=Limulus polyphemus TaxID=6850 RepID=A0ABM1C5X7_LIMPO|nr:bridging integrator 3-like [Limulus polyphemus]